MKKYYLKELKDEEIEKILKNNNKFENIIFNDFYEDQMDAQYYESMELLKDVQQYYRYYDNYNSFYFRITDGLKFIENIDFHTLKGYCLDVEELEKESKKELNILNKCNFGSDKYYDHIEKIEILAQKILDLIEKELHTYENYDFSDIFDYLLNNIDLYENYYIKNKKDFKVYEKINYEKEIA